MRIYVLTVAVIWSFSVFSWSAENFDGENIYKQSCALCHGQNREGGVGPNLADKEWVKVKPEQDALVEFISKGSLSVGMPAWQGILEKEKIADVADFLLHPISKSVSVSSNTTSASDPYPELRKLHVPVGFSISVYADKIETARAMVVSPSGIVFVASPNAGKIYAIVDSDNDFIVDKVVTVIDGLDNPIGVTYLNGSLFIAEQFRVILIDEIEKTYSKKPIFKVIKSDFLHQKIHAGKIIKAGPDGKLYIPIGAPCNVCDVEEELFGKIYRMDPDGSNFELYAKGVRNSVGFAWEPTTKELWFTDNGRDLLGDNTPSCELNKAPKAGIHFGFPYCHSGIVVDPEFGKGKNCDEFMPPVAKLGPHIAPLGLAFYEGTQFPAEYKNQLFIAEHGSWNRSQKIGYRVNLVTLVNNQAVTDVPFVDGFLQGEEVLGRPVDIAFLRDGSMLVSDDYRGRIYRITYSTSKK